MKVSLIGSGQLAAALKEAIGDGHRLVGPELADVVWLAEDTHVEPDGTANLNYVRAVAHDAVQAMPMNTTLLISSQVPVGFTRSWSRTIESMRPGHGIECAYLVENIKADSGGRGWTSQAGFVIGLSQTGTPSRASRAVETLLGIWPHQRRAFLQWESAELVKLTINALLAGIIELVNEIGDLAPLVLANKDELEAGLRCDLRLTNCPVKPNGGFSNAHLGRDLKFLMSMARETDKLLPLVGDIYTFNRNRKEGSLATSFL